MYPSFASSLPTLPCLLTVRALEPEQPLSLPAQEV
jgi:hypothetical protein